MSPSNSRPAGRIGWLFKVFARQIWVRATLFSVGAVIVALLAAFIGPYIPYDPTLTLASGSVDNILNILATSMLAVTTFSLSIMVSAYAAASSGVTPRSTQLLLADSTAQNTLSTFVGSFLFSVVGVIGLASGLYPAEGRVLLFFATLIVLLIVVAALLRWIEHLGRFGRVGDTILRVEAATRGPLAAAASNPCLGARPAVAVPAEAIALRADCGGYIQHIDVEELDHIAGQDGLTVHVAVLAGSMVHPRRILMHVEPYPGAEQMECLRACFSIGKERSFDHDPRFGIIVLSEIASRALSPAVNDPGTAIDVASAGLRLFLAFGEGRSRAAGEVRYGRVHMPLIDVEELMFSFFNPIARDGAALVEVQQKLVVVLAALADNHPAIFATTARDLGRRILERSQGGMASADDRSLLATTVSQHAALI